MDYTQVKDMQSRFDNLVRRVPGEDIEFWFARDLQELLGYDNWVNFSIVLRRAIGACGATEFEPADHFRGVTRGAILGRDVECGDVTYGDVECDVEDFMLTRYGCYLIAQHANPGRATIVFAQSYFAIQTRKQKLVNDRMRLQALIDGRAGLREPRAFASGNHSSNNYSSNGYEHGTDDEGFMRIRIRDEVFNAEQNQRKPPPQQMVADDVKTLARRLKGELHGLVRDFLT
ncbi:BRO family protein [Cellvibrio mixtus]|uniref:BRO family protein n=1 Tax=Cellvibrio mixtus TaxID=39650 RepID=UPI0006934BAD|nr:BRO family protein [Cellvibrio mixtus]